MTPGTHGAGTPTRLVHSALLALVGLLVAGWCAVPAAAQSDVSRMKQVLARVEQLQRDDRAADAVAALDDALATLHVPALWEAYSLVARAECQRYLGRVIESAEDLDLAEELLGDESSGGLILANIHGTRALLALEAGLVDVAAGHAAAQRRQVELSRAPDEPPPIEWFFANRGQARLLLAQDDFVGAVAAIDAWLGDPVYQLPEHRVHAANLRALQAFALDELEENDPGRPRRAAALLEESLGELPILEQPRALLTLADIAMRLGDLAGAGQRLAAVERLLAASERERDADVHPERLFFTALAARHARLAGQPLAPWAERLQQQHARFVARVSALPLRPGGYGPLHYLTSLTLLSELFELTLQLQPDDVAVQSALAAFLEVSALGTLARVLGAPVPSVDEIRAELLLDDGAGRPSHGLLVYVPTHWATHLFVLDRDALHHVRLARDDVLDAARRALLASFGGPRDAEHLAREAGLRQDLAALLLPPEVLALTQGWTRWTIVGTEVLGEVPFEMLPRGDEPFLGAAVAVDRLPSVPVGLALARRLRAGGRADGEQLAARALATGALARLLAALSPSAAARALSPDLPELALGEREVQRVLAAYDPARVEELVGPRATLDALRGGERARVWQLLGHGVYDATRERPSGIALAPGAADADGLLWPELVAQLEPAELVLLTACRAGKAPRRRGDAGAADLGGAFLEAGASTVVLSSFDLELQTVLRLSASFHAELLAGASPAEALRRARVALLEDPRFADPLLAFTLQVVGLGQRPLFAAPPAGPARIGWWLTGLGLVVAGAVLGVARRRRGG